MVVGVAIRTIVSRVIRIVMGKKRRILEMVGLGAQGEDRESGRKLDQSRRIYAEIPDH